MFLRLEAGNCSVAIQLDFMDTLVPPQRPDRPLTPAMTRALIAATSRPDGAILPVSGLNTAAAQALAGALVRRGMAQHDAGLASGPVINLSGRAAVRGES